MARVLSYLLSLVCLGPLLLTVHRVQTRHPQGLNVLLGRTCPKDLDIDERLLFIRDLGDGRYLLNERPGDEMQTRQLLRQALQRRVEKLVWVAADDRMAYGRVVATISHLQQDTPDLHIAIATRSQIGTVDPIVIERLHGRNPDGTPIGVLPCVFAKPNELL